MATKKKKPLSTLTLAVMLAVITFIGIFILSKASTPTDITRTKAAPMFATVGVIGDSTSDEYRADDNRGGAYGAITFNWIEQLVKFRNINFGQYSTWGGFRRTGYEYNFARSGATTKSALDAGAHSSLGALVQSGAVPFVYYSLGANDYAWYNSAFGQIYNGQLTGTALVAYNQQVATNVKTAIDTINASGKAKMLISLIPDMTLSPGARAKYPDATKLKKVSDAIKSTNDQIKLIVSQRGYAIFDADAVATKLFGLIDSQGNMTVGGEKISFATPGDEPHHVLLSDSIHSGTVVSGFYANEWITTVNTLFGTDVAVFTPDELLIHAGIKAATPVPTITATPTQSPVVTTRPTLTPSPLPTITPTVRPTLTPTPIPTIAPTARPTTTPTVRPTVTPTVRPTVTPIASVTPRPTATTTPTDPYLQYCGTYRRFRYFALRFLSSSQVREWDLRCGI